MHRRRKVDEKTCVTFLLCVVFFKLTDRASTIPSNFSLKKIYVVANPVRGHKEVPRSTGHIMVTTRYSDQQGSKSRQKSYATLQAMAPTNTPAGTSNELDVQNIWEENPHTKIHTHTHGYVCVFIKLHITCVCV